MKPLNAMNPYELEAELSRRKEQAKKEQAEREKGILWATVSKDDMFRFGFMPFVIGEVVWDFADTALDVSALYHLPNKAACRQVRDLRRDYQRLRGKLFDGSTAALQDDSMEQWQDEQGALVARLSPFVANCLFRWEAANGQQLSEGERAAAKAVYCATAYLAALVQFSEHWRAFLSRKLSRRVGTTVPTQTLDLWRLLPSLLQHPYIDQQTLQPFADEIRRAMDGAEFFGGCQQPELKMIQQ